MQNCVLHSLQKGENPDFLDAARAFMPSCTKVLGVPKEESDYLGGWSARGSDTYTRVAVRVISNLNGSSSGR